MRLVEICFIGTTDSSSCWICAFRSTRIISRYSSPGKSYKKYRRNLLELSLSQRIVLTASSLVRFDAFTHKPTSQYSLAYEKASIIFNISAVLSCHAALQNRFEDTGLKTAYHSFQASAGMYTYINENFLHAPSTDLSRETVKTLIAIMLAQGQEVFLEKQIADGKKVGLLAKLASQAAYLYTQAVEGVQENVNKAIFEKVWLQVVQVWKPLICDICKGPQGLTRTGKSQLHDIAISILSSSGRQRCQLSRHIDLQTASS